MGNNSEPDFMCVSPKYKEYLSYEIKFQCWDLLLDIYSIIVL